ncbi:hypothetical protein JOM56_012465 [Amanita muscaria]
MRHSFRVELRQDDGALLPQPPHQQERYEGHQVLGTGTFGKVVLATWNVPPEQVAIAEHGAVAAAASSVLSVPLTTQVIQAD